METYLEPWLGEQGQAAFDGQHRQLRQPDTADYEQLLGGIDIPVQLLWGRADRILSPPYAQWLQARLPAALERASRHGAGELDGECRRAGA